MLSVIPLFVGVALGAGGMLLHQIVHNLSEQVRMLFQCPSVLVAQHKRLCNAMKKYPLLMPFVVVMTPVLAIVERCASLYEFLFCSANSIEMIKLTNALQCASDYTEWRSIASDLDFLDGATDWREDTGDLMCDYPLIKRRLEQLQEMRRSGNWKAIAQRLRSGLQRHQGGTGNAELFLRSRVGTKLLIEEYHSEVVEQLNYLCRNTFEGWDEQEKFNFFWETRQSFGRSALLLSGGASFGVYHIGVLKELWAQDLLPRIVCGASVGSVMAAVLCTRKPDEIVNAFDATKFNLDAFESLAPGQLMRKVNRLINQGVLMDISRLERCLRDNLSDITFIEAYKLTGRVLNISISGTTAFQKPHLLNYLTTPNVLIWSASLASCAVPGLFAAVPLYMKTTDGKVAHWDETEDLTWSDGSMEHDLPMHRLSELFNVNHFIVSQLNPHVVAFINDNHRRSYWGQLKFLCASELSHRIRQLNAIGALPTSLALLVDLSQQQYSGDITVVPPITIFDYQKVIVNPSVEYVNRGIDIGQRAIWPKVHEIRTQFEIEATLERCVADLRQQLYGSECPGATFMTGSERGQAE